MVTTTNDSSEAEEAPDNTTGRAQTRKALHYGIHEKKKMCDSTAQVNCAGLGENDVRRDHS